MTTSQLKRAAELLRQESAGHRDHQRLEMYELANALEAMAAAPGNAELIAEIDEGLRSMQGMWPYQIGALLRRCRAALESAK